MSELHTADQSVNHGAALLNAYLSLREQQPNVRAKDAADRLGVSEAQLLSVRPDLVAIRLIEPFSAILEALEPLGSVMALTRNPQAVHERHGVYSNVSVKGPMGLVLNPDIDLRLFMHQWHSAFAVEEAGRFSLQFFNAHGLAVHKIYATDQTDMALWPVLIEQFRWADAPALNIQPLPDTPPAVLPAEFDRAAFQAEWADLRDVHQYHGLLNKHGLTRTQALEQIGDQWVTELCADALVHALTLASERTQPIMVFVGNSGCIQIHSGEVSRLLERGGWFNVLDPAFNLHLKVGEVDRVWLIKRPSDDGIITSLEGFNAKGESVITLFGQRKPGVPELDGWRAIAAEVAERTSAQEAGS
jgi:putative hemin transport protein